MEVTWQKVAFLGGLAAAGAALVYLLQPVEDEEIITPSPPKQKQKKSSVSSVPAPPAPKAEEIKKSVPEPKLHKDDLIRVFDKKQLRQAFLIERRKHFNQDKEQYQQTISQYIEGQSKVNDSAFLEVLEEENITNNDLENAMRKFGNDSQVLNAMGAIRDNLSNPVPVPESLTLEKIQEIIEFQIEKLRERKGNATSRLELIEAQSEVSDCIHDKFGYEDEEVLAAIGKYKSEIPKLGEYMKDMEQATKEVFKSS